MNLIHYKKLLKNKLKENLMQTRDKFVHDKFHTTLHGRYQRLICEISGVTQERVA